MNVRILKTGDTADIADSYARRLIEQGEAVAVEKTEKKSTGKGKKANEEG